MVIKGPEVSKVNICYIGHLKCTPVKIKTISCAEFGTAVNPKKDAKEQNPLT